MAIWGAEIQPEDLRKGDKVYIRHKDTDSSYLFEVKESKMIKLSGGGDDSKHHYAKVWPIRTLSGSIVTTMMRKGLNQPLECYDFDTTFFREVSRSSPQTMSERAANEYAFPNLHFGHGPIAGNGWRCGHGSWT